MRYVIFIDKNIEANVGISCHDIKFSLTIQTQDHNRLLLQYIVLNYIRLCFLYYSFVS